MQRQCFPKNKYPTLIAKQFPNTFRETDLLEKLKSAGIKQLLPCGIMIGMYADAMVRTAFDLGLASDACATSNLESNNEIIPANHVHGVFWLPWELVYATKGMQ